MSLERTNPGADPAPEVLWAELEPGSHVVQFCDHDASLLETLEAYVAGGLLLGESVVVVATAAHLGELRQRLRTRGMDVANLQIFGQLVPVDAEQLLRRVVRRGRLDPHIFGAVVADTLQRARADDRPVRVFGEAVQLLWERGERAAMLALEREWQRICAAEGIALLCAYRKDSFKTCSADDSIRAICAAHGAVIA